METALLMGTLIAQQTTTGIIAGAALGVVVAAGIAALWSRSGHRVNLALFVGWLVFAAQIGGRTAHVPTQQPVAR